MESLLKSFQDAIKITQRLGIRYLWIDSLCIIQDDTLDLELECTKMASVYGKSYLTIAATAASDVQEGCFQTFDPSRRISFGGTSVFVRFESNLWLDSMGISGDDWAPLNQRGWTLQESVLSRHIIHFDWYQLSWTCATRVTCKDGTVDTLDMPSSRTPVSLQASLCRMRHSDEIYSSWRRLAKKYSRRKLTYSQDKLAALAGIISTFQDVTGDTPLAGLWGNDLHSGLLWETSTLMNPIKCLDIPSWFWAFVDGSISYSGRTFIPERYSTNKKLEILNTHVAWSGPALSSRITEAKIVVRGLLKAVGTGEQAGGNHSFYLVPFLNALDDPPTLGYCKFDVSQPPRNGFWCLEVSTTVRRKWPEVDTEYDHNVLALLPTYKTDNEFFRIRIGVIWHRSLFTGRVKGSITFEEVKSRTITIV